MKGWPTFEVRADRTTRGGAAPAGSVRLAPSLLLSPLRSC